MAAMVFGSGELATVIGMKTTLTTWIPIADPLTRSAVPSTESADPLAEIIDPLAEITAPLTLNGVHVDEGAEETPSSAVMAFSAFRVKPTCRLFVAALEAGEP